MADRKGLSEFVRGDAEPTRTPDAAPSDLRREIVDSFEYGYGPTLIAAAFAFFLAFADPSHEVMISLAQDAQRSFLTGDFMTDAVKLTSTVILFVLVPVSIFVSLELALSARDDGDGRDGAGGRSVLASLPRDARAGRPDTLRERVDYHYRMVASRLPIIGAAWGAFVTAIGPEAEAAGVVIVLFIVAAILFAIFVGSFFRFFQRGALAALRNWFRDKIRYLTAVILIIAVFIALFPVLSSELGPVAVASTFVIVASFALALLTRASANTQSRFPLIIGVILLAFAGDNAWIGIALGLGLIVVVMGIHFQRYGVLSWRPLLPLAGPIAAVYIAIGLLTNLVPDCGLPAGCNLVRGDAADVSGSEKVEILGALAEWGGGADVAEQPERLRIVAAQGGGLYAAYHTAYFLAAETDKDPDFARSVFAISGVSGGAVGGGIYWAILESGVCDGLREAVPDCHAQAVQQILRHDFLSPPLAGLLFRDLYDTFIPFSVAFNRPIDRGDVLLRSFKRRMSACCTFVASDGSLIERPMDGALLDRSLQSSFAPGLPLLFLNTTDVSSGQRVVASPVEDFRANQIHRAGALIRISADQTVGNAMLDSARFPLVSPPARYLRRERDESEGGYGSILQPLPPRQFVDGGYFDNSGLETVYDILDETEFARILLATDKEIRRIPIEVIAFDIFESPAPETMKGALGASVAAIGSTWATREDLSFARFCERWNVDGTDSVKFPTRPDFVEIRSRRNAIHAETFNFTLSWLLTDSTFEDIEDKVDAFERDTPDGLERRFCNAGLRQPGSL